MFSDHVTSKPACACFCTLGSRYLFLITIATSYVLTSQVTHAKPFSLDLQLTVGLFEMLCTVMLYGYFKAPLTGGYSEALST